MGERWAALKGWVSKALAEGHDSYGAYEWPLGGAIFVGYAIAEWQSAARPGLVSLAFYFLLALALWEGSRVEQEQLRALGRRRFRGTLALRLTWILLVGALAFACLLIGFAHARTWNWLEGWHDGPIVLTLVLGLYSLSTGLKVGVRRWILLGVVLCGLAAVLPVIPGLRFRLYFVTGLLLGAALVGSGMYGRVVFLRRLRALTRL